MKNSEVIQRFEELFDSKDESKSEKLTEFISANPLYAMVYIEYLGLLSQINSTKINRIALDLAFKEKFKEKTK